VVVLAGRNAAWVLGVVGALRPASPETSDGVAAQVDADVLTVRDARGDVLFTHDARTGTSTVTGREVHLKADELAMSARKVSIEGSQEVRIGRGEDTLVMTEKETKLRAARFVGSLGEGRFSIRDVIFGAQSVETAVGRARQVVEVAELTAGRIVERSKDVFRETEGVAQTRAGRIRMVAEGVFSVLSERATLKAEDNMAIMGEKIELG